MEPLPRPSRAIALGLRRRSGRGSGRPVSRWATPGATASSLPVAMAAGPADRRRSATVSPTSWPGRPGPYRSSYATDVNRPASRCARRSRVAASRSGAPTRTTSHCGPRAAGSCHSLMPPSCPRLSMRATTTADGTGLDPPRGWPVGVVLNPDSAFVMALDAEARQKVFVKLEPHRVQGVDPGFVDPFPLPLVDPRERGLQSGPTRGCPRTRRAAPSCTPRRPAAPRPRRRGRARNGAPPRRRPSCP